MPRQCDPKPMTQNVRGQTPRAQAQCKQMRIESLDTRIPSRYYRSVDDCGVHKRQKSFSKGNSAVLVPPRHFQC